MTTALLQVDHLHVRYAVAGGRSLHAIDDADFSIAHGEALGVVGESGSGKSTLARALLGLQPLAAGRVLLEGQEFGSLRAAQRRTQRRALQMVFQDPLASLDPRMRVERIVAEPLLAFEPALGAVARRARAARVLEAVGLGAASLQRYPHEISGGQAQRVAIARALICEPRLLVCDEPVASLDAAVRIQVLDLLAGLRRERPLALLFIAHDLPAIQRLCDRVLVLYLGRVMEIVPAAGLAGSACHPYTQALLAAAPLLDPQQARSRRAAARAAPVIVQEAPSPMDPPSGCVFRTRCPWVMERCAVERPVLRAVGQSLVACHRAEETTDAAQSGPAQSRSAQSR